MICWTQIQEGRRIYDTSFREGEIVLGVDLAPTTSTGEARVEASATRKRPVMATVSAPSVISLSRL